MTLCHLSAENLIARQRMLQKLWRQNNPEKVQAYYKKHQARPEYRERMKQWRLEHRDEQNLKARNRHRANLGRPPESEPVPGPEGASIAAFALKLDDLPIMVS